MATIPPTLRAATDDDVERLTVWHADPDVARFWDGETHTADEIRERLERQDVEAWIVEAGGESVRGGLDGFLVPAARGDGSCRPSRASWRRVCSTGAGGR